MKTFIVICLIAATFAEHALRDVLRSPKETLKLYKDFKSSQHLSFGASEDRMRFQLFRNNAEFVADANENSDSAVFGLNFFSSMTREEKQQYRGLNITGHHANEVMLASPGFQAPAKKLWTNEGAVTAVSNQGACGSCWTFGAVGGLETRYQQLSGRLRKFAEQEYLDCVYESEGNGCYGGWPNHAYTYSLYNNGRLAATKDYPYTQRDATCKGSSTRNAAIAGRIMGYIRVGATEAANIEALASGSLAVGFEATDFFDQYYTGILKDTSCHGRANHAVTLVGYTEDFILAKNSYGSYWGDKGFVKFSRNHGNCQLYKYSSYPRLSPTGTSDKYPSDAATDYRPSEDDDVDVCKDEIDCDADFCEFPKLAESYCRKTCNKCT